MGVQGVSGGSSGTPIHTGAGHGGAVRAGGVVPRPYAWIGGAVRGENTDCHASLWAGSQ